MNQTKFFNLGFVLLLGLLFASRILFAQEYATVGADDDTTEIENNLLIEAQVLLDNKPFEGVIIQVVNETRKSIIKDTTKSTGFFSVKLDFDSVYVIHFMKDGYVTKKVEVDTRNMVEEEKSFGYDLGMFKLSMLKKETSTDYSVYLEPVARFRYSETSQIFVVDRKYKKEVKKRFEEKDQEPEIIKF